MSGKYTLFEGIPLVRELISPEFLSKEWKEFEFKEDDILLLSYPKSGTHWMSEILSLISKKGDPKWIYSVLIEKRVPWLESVEGYELITNEKGPRLIISHLPVKLMPKSLFTSKAKVVYMIRNPRDTLVSGYFFTKILTVGKKFSSFEEYFQWFLQGKVLYGSWFKHTQDWMPLREKENFLLLSYEELKRDTRSTIEKICQFLGKNLEPEEIDSVLKHSSFQVMKNNKMSNHTLSDTDIFDWTCGSFMRKGICGDWRNHFTVAQAEAFDRTFQEKMAGLPPDLFPWE